MIPRGDGKDKTGEDSAERIIHAIRMLVRALDVLSRKLASSSGITSPQLACLRQIVRTRPAKATDVATEVHLSPSTVVGIIDRLEEKGLVTRERDTQDRRVVFLTATDLGEAVVKETPHPVRAMFNGRLENDLKEEDYERIAQALEDIVHALGASGGESEKPLDSVGPVDAGERSRP